MVTSFYTEIEKRIPLELHFGRHFAESIKELNDLLGVSRIYPAVFAVRWGSRECLKLFVGDFEKFHHLRVCQPFTGIQFCFKFIWNGSEKAGIIQFCFDSSESCDFCGMLIFNTGFRSCCGTVFVVSFN